MKRYQYGLYFLATLLFALSINLTGLVLSQKKVKAQGITLGEEELRPIIKAQKNNEDKLLAIPGVVAVGTGLTEDGRPAIHVYFNRDVPTASSASIPIQVDRIPVRMLETDEIMAFDGPPGTNHREVFDFPVPMGVSTSSDNGCPYIVFAGTLGARVFVTVQSSKVGYIGARVFVTVQSSKVGYITNNHVAAAGGPNLCPNKASLGEDQFQPGTFESGCPPVHPKIGDLNKFIPIIFNGFSNKVDAAFVLSTRSLVNKEILDIGNPSPLVEAPAVGLSVIKSGRATGLTTGTIQTINATINVSYGPCGIAKFVGQIIIVGDNGSFSQEGDSGALIVGSKDSLGRRKPVGLLFAGSSSITAANRIGNVLTALNVQIDTQ